jgi:hypothetical protein
MWAFRRAASDEQQNPEQQRPPQQREPTRVACALRRNLRFQPALPMGSDAGREPSDVLGEVAELKV